MKNEGFVKVAKKSDIPLSHMKELQVNGQGVCVANIDGKYFAINNICSHEGGPLADGKLQGYEVECPWHQSKFDMQERLRPLQLLNRKVPMKLRYLERI
jgi:nitrite reductase/ring-hydroxylating ferredoxin subunit